MTNIHVETFSLAGTTTEGVFAGTGLTPGKYHVKVQVPASAASVYVVNSATDTTGYEFPGGVATSDGIALFTDSSEIYLYNSSGTAVTVWVLFTPASGAGPVSATFNY
jgi:hypothetical protein